MFKNKIKIKLDTINENKSYKSSFFRPRFPTTRIKKTTPARQRNFPINCQNFTKNIVPVNCERVKMIGRIYSSLLWCWSSVSSLCLLCLHSVCLVCVHAAPAYSLPGLSNALNGPHSHAHFCLFSEPGAKPNGMGKRGREGIVYIIEPWYLSRFHKIILRNLVRCYCA